MVIEKYYPRLTLDFQTNKRVLDEVALVPSKRLRNKVGPRHLVRRRAERGAAQIAGFTTHLMRRIQKGPVRGISFKLQEEERERRDNWVPDVSALNTESIEIDVDTKELLASINLGHLSGVTVQSAAGEQKPFRKDHHGKDHHGKEKGERKERKRQ